MMNLFCFGQVIVTLTLRVVRRCQAEFGSVGLRRYLTVGTFLAQYLLPLTLTTASYLHIMHRLSNRATDLGNKQTFSKISFVVVAAR